MLAIIQASLQPYNECKGPQCLILERGPPFYGKVVRDGIGLQLEEDKGRGSNWGAI